MQLSDYLGFIGGALTTIAFVPQLIKAWKTKRTEDLSLTMLCIFTTGVLLWLIFGIMTQSLPIIMANVVTCILALCILVLKIKYK